MSAQYKTILQIEGLTKRYGNLTAVDSLDLEVDRGEIFGFLGPNGAGKTTTIKAMTGLLHPTEGDIRIGDKRLSKDPREATIDVGYLPENVRLYDNLTGRETLKFIADVRNVDVDIDESLEKVNLLEHANRKVGDYSKGMVQRLAFAQSVLGNPELLILDEPTSGLDPEGTVVVKEMVKEYTKSGGTVFFSSHILPNVQEVADRVGIITKGKLIAIDSVENLRDKLELPTELEIKISDDAKKVVNALEGSQLVKKFHAKGTKVTITCDSEDKMKVIHLVEDQGVEILDFNADYGDLEDIFMRYTGGEE
ncbi:MAG: ABC transporter ATP-binding protein [Thermoplasmatota archaeon]